MTTSPKPLPLRDAAELALEALGSCVPLMNGSDLLHYNKSKVRKALASLQSSLAAEQPKGAKSDDAQHEAFELSVIELLGIKALAKEGLSHYDTAKMFFDAGAKWANALTSAQLGVAEELREILQPIQTLIDWCCFTNNEKQLSLKDAAQSALLKIEDAAFQAKRVADRVTPALELAENFCATYEPHMQIIRQARDALLLAAPNPPLSGWADISSADKTKTIIVANDLGEVCPAIWNEHHWIIQNSHGNPWTYGHDVKYWQPIPSPPHLADNGRNEA